MARLVFPLLLFLALVPSLVQAQSERPWEQLYEQICDNDEEDLPALDDIFEQLCQLEDHPIDINTATKEQLEQLPFLSDVQIEDICYHLYLYGAFASKAELLSIRSLDYYRRLLLEHFIYIGETGKSGFPSLKNIAKYGKHQLTGMVKVPFYERKGDKKGFQGYPYKHYLKYDFHYGDYVKLGAVAAQDAGEPFFSGKNQWGYDFYSFYLVVKNWKSIKTLALGKYRVSWGLGLVANNDFSLGKLASLSSLGRLSGGIKAHSSLSAYNYQQGAATTIAVNRHFDVSAFFSYRDIDATLDNTSHTITTILKTGYHRTKSELERKNNASQLNSGIRFAYTNGALRLGLNGVYTHFDHDLKPNTSQAFRRYYPTGNDFMNFSADYSYMHHRWSAKGETAIDRQGQLATINTLGIQATAALTAMVLQRFYSYRYNGLLANSFGSGSSVQNESGVYLGINYKPSQDFSVIAYTDIAYFPWKRYQASASSHAYDNLVQLAFHRGQFSASARYQLKMQQKDNAKKTRLVYDTTHRGRLWASYDFTTFSTRMQADFALSRYKQQSIGWMLGNTSSLNIVKNLTVNTTVGYFHTDDYASRLYVYEPGLLYAFSYGMFYGKGIHGAIRLRFSPGNHIVVIAKATTTRYFDRTKISSGLNEIDGRQMTDLQLQLKLKL